MVLERSEIRIDPDPLLGEEIRMREPVRSISSRTVAPTASLTEQYGD